MNQIDLKHFRSSRFLMARLDGDLEMIAEFKLTKNDSNIVRELATIHNSVNSLLTKGDNSND